MNSSTEELDYSEHLNSFNLTANDADEFDDEDEIKRRSIIKKKLIFLCI
jgi:hypothetical protein